MSLRIKLRVDSRLRMAAADLPAPLLEAIRESFTYDNPDRRRLKELESLAKRGRNPKVWAMLMQARKAPEQITTCIETNGEISVPRGGLSKLRALCVEHDLSFRVEDNRVTGHVETPRGPKLQLGPPDYVHKVKLYDFQEAMVSAALEKQNCLWRSPTASGKTTAALALAVEAGLPTLVIVWTSNLMQQWIERCVNELDMPMSEVGVIGGGRMHLKPITIGMQQSLMNNVEQIASLFGTVICDEVDRFAAKTFLSVIDRIPAKHRLGVAADERRKDKKEFLIYDAFGEVVGEVSREELIQRRIVHDVEIVMVPTNFAPDWYLDMPVASRGYAQDRLLEAIVADKPRNRLALEIMASEMRAGHQVLTFSHRVEHARRIEADIRSTFAARDDALPGTATGLMLGEASNASEFQRCVKGFADGSVRAASGTYQAIGYGIDLPSVSRGFALSPIHNNRTFVNQVRGRLCRTSSVTKNDARLYYLWDVEIFGKRPLENLLRWNSKVVVMSGHAEWVDGKKYLRELEDAQDRKDHDDDDGTDFLGILDGR